MSGEALFNEVQKAFLVLSALGPAAIWYLMFKFSSREIPEHQTEGYVMMLWYGGTSGILIGQVFGHIIPNALIGGFVSIKMMGICVGILGLIVAYKLHRICTWEKYTNSPSPLLETSSAIDQDSQEEKDFHVVDYGKPLDEQMLPTKGAKDNLRLHRTIGLILFLSFQFSIVIEGFVLLYNPRDSSPAGLVAAVWLLRVMQTIATSTYSIYSKLHRRQERGSVKKLYLFLSVLWCITIILSTIPALMDIDIEFVSRVVEHPALGTFYSIFGGFSLTISFLFLFTFFKCVTKSDQIFYILSMLGGCAATYTIGLWV